MPSDHLVIAGLFPLRGADEVLRFEERVAEHVGVRGHGYVFVCREGFPDLVQEGAVVDAHGWGDALAEASPVLRWQMSADNLIVEGKVVLANLGVIAFGPFEEGGVEA